ncbi:hypothetical protein N7457_008716 [Penicillium paradoxum]|uniref:uncharacterized protein n=1 Tax=Penicillium paradoxum TaxID=176176 RepID=UPI0025480177|nr:uncharacterized protein N7457_008716 [Penicillium paradoxum]KAJ5773820.1 hypothetical protein N7457_008716 [Penicillium paradoxum]
MVHLPPDHSDQEQEETGDIPIDPQLLTTLQPPDNPQIGAIPVNSPLNHDSPSEEPLETEFSIGGALPNAAEWPHEENWTSSRPIPPQPGLRCPYCNYQPPKRQKKVQQAPSELRRHIRQYHLMKDIIKYPGISVKMSRPREYSLTYGERPSLNNNNI